MPVKWWYRGIEDFKRPHANRSLFHRKKRISKKTIQQIEYRWSSFGRVKILGITPKGEKQNRIFLPRSIFKHDNSYSEIKFYFNYPASRAVEEKPSRLVITLKNNKKLIRTRLLVGWYSQNPDGMPGYMKSVPITEKDVLIPPDLEGEGFTLSLELNEDDYQTAAYNETDTSFNFLYFVLWQKDETYSQYKLGEQFSFDTYIE